MAHSIRFTYDTPRSDVVLKEDEIEDLIEMLYRWGDTRFHIIFSDKHKKWRGSAQWRALEREHEINIYVDNIKKDVKTGIAIAGSQPAPEGSIRAGIAMVLCHELQHCNQVKFHKQDAKSTFYGGHQYWNLASEREARGYVDEKLNEICAYFNIKPTMRRAAVHTDGDESKEVKAIIRLLSECDRVTSDDINDELRASNLMSPANFSAVKRGLLKKGIKTSAR